ncbi:FtsX-like permease family protein [Dermabacter sp. Marseille-Q3180]|uniref:ABC transporter permease n=1 Tax=Dermabacter sp. Marseille-Q3180 TaxID=2758090 RepID=UPI002024A970|nr:FtsX-like permease family protein [Dermabacter sp. Marseille-Q3180]
MFLAIRDLRFAKGRFGLIVAVVSLMTFLVTFLAGLTGGLAMQNISAMLSLNPDKVVLSVDEGEQEEFSNSEITKEQFDAWAAKAGDNAVTPLGISSALLDTGEKTESVVLMAEPSGSDERIPEAGKLVLGETTAESLGVQAGDTVDVAGERLAVDRVIKDEFHSHRPVAFASLDTWHDFLERTHQPGGYATTILVGAEGADASSALTDDDITALDRDQSTTTKSLLPSLLAIGSFRSEIGSLAMMIALLVLISTLVIGVFFLVWSMQRQRDIAVLKAIGARTGWLAGDSLWQALIVLGIGSLIGVGLTAGLGALAANAMPFVMNALTLVGVPILMLLAGLVGSLVSVRTITKVDPTKALQASAA